MLSIKNQKYIFDRLLKGYPVSYYQLDDYRIAFTDGVRIFIFSKEQIKFDISKCTPSKKMKEILHDALGGHEVTPSEEIKAYNSMGKNYRKLQRNDGQAETWVEDKFVKDYNACTFIHCGGKNPICVLDDIGDLIAAIMPCDVNGSLRK